MWVCSACRFLVVCSRVNLEATNGTGLNCGCRRGVFRRVQEPFVSALVELHAIFMEGDEAAKRLGLSYPAGQDSSSPIHTIFRDPQWVRQVRARSRRG